ncbi:polysaccharide biosynthesis tyrosine autokinase [Aliiglaciecola sp. CAU 1673]|uniref:GumC family protein n=1 Tax=Aliiglaciecola sp. CAU 1673 TaxID=3032595 RepID=UPI0023D99CCC|nr:polysaccharide biosynthesis tyrosine autokinase [Aliiglaciecola sp. CAU 1673]MDF2179797.1 polysaccharide biosynthesis tyrosine autokinase [Aliiglaciecola sp. CAU 1673]
MATELSPDKQFSPEAMTSPAQVVLFFWRKKWRILFLAALMAVGAGFYILQLPKVYTASSTLLLGGADKGMPLPNINIGQTTGDTEMDTYIEFMRSRTFAQAVIEHLNLQDEAEYADISSESELISKFRSNLAVSQVKNTHMVKVTFSSRSPETAQSVADDIGPTFFEFHAKLEQQKVQNRSDNLNIQLMEIQQRLANSELTVQEYVRKYDIVDLKAQLSLAQNEINELVKEQMQHERKLSELRITYHQALAARDDFNALLGQSWLMESPSVVEARRQWVMQKEAMERVKDRYKHKHPKYIQAQTDLASAEQELKKRVDEHLAALKQSIAASEQRTKELRVELEKNNEAFRELGDHQTVLTRLQQELDANHKIHDLFLSKLQEMEMLKDLGQTKEFAVVDRATLPKFPSKPNVIGLLFMACSFSFVFSGGFWFVFSLVGDKTGRLIHAARLMEVTVLALLPKIGRQFLHRRAAPLRTGLGDKNYRYAEGIRSLRTTMLIGPFASKQHIIAVTAIKSGQGKASVVSNLADSLSNVEPILLADLDLRAPSLARAYNLDLQKPGITDFFDGKAKLSVCMYHKNNGRLTLLPSGKIPADPLALISTQKFAEFIKKLNTKFPRMLVEAPPVNSVSDALILTRLVDGVIVVCDVENTEVQELTDIIQNLREANTPLLGIVFNRVKDN